MNDLTEKVIGAAMEVHRHLGPGLLESIYEVCLAQELSAKSIQYERQKSFPISYKNIPLAEGCRIDFLVEDQLVLEIKSVDLVAPIHISQLLTYLRLLNKKRGLIFNFNVPILRDGIKRISL